MKESIMDKPIIPFLLLVVFMGGFLSFTKDTDSVIREKDMGEWHQSAERYAANINEKKLSFDNITAETLGVEESYGACPYTTSSGRYCKFVTKTPTQKAIMEVKEDRYSSKTHRAIIFERQDDGGVKATVAELE